jgi:hypothetical protein
MDQSRPPFDPVSMLYRLQVVAQRLGLTGPASSHGHTADTYYRPSLSFLKSIPKQCLRAPDREIRPLQFSKVARTAEDACPGGPSLGITCC